MWHIFKYMQFFLLDKWRQYKTTVPLFPYMIILG